MVTKYIILISSKEHRETMTKKESRVTRIARLTLKQFPSLSASGTNVIELVRFVLAKRAKIERSHREKIGDDVRDYINISYFLRPLSKKALAHITTLGSRDTHRRLEEKVYPFSPLNKKTRETLLHLPNSWIHGAANRLLADGDI